METGLRKDADGNTIPRKIINRFTCEYGGEMVIDMELEGAVSANPYIEFDIMPGDATEVVFTWYEDGGASTPKRKSFRSVNSTWSCASLGGDV